MNSTLVTRHDGGACPSDGNGAGGGDAPVGLPQFVPRPSNLLAIVRGTQRDLENAMQMGVVLGISVDEARGKLLEFIRTTRQEVRQHLDVTKPWPHQSQRARKRVEKAILTRLPELNVYEGAWPVAVYINKFLRAIHRHCRVNANPNVKVDGLFKPDIGIASVSESGKIARPIPKKLRITMDHVAVPSIPDQVSRGSTRRMTEPGPTLTKEAQFFLELRQLEVLPYEIYKICTQNDFLCFLKRDTLSRRRFFQTFVVGIEGQMTLAQFEALMELYTRYSY